MLHDLAKWEDKLRPMCEKLRKTVTDSFKVVEYGSMRQDTAASIDFDVDLKVVVTGVDVREQFDGGLEQLLHSVRAQLLHSGRERGGAPFGGGGRFPGVSTQPTISIAMGLSTQPAALTYSEGGGGAGGRFVALARDGQRSYLSEREKLYRALHKLGYTEAHGGGNIAPFTVDVSLFSDAARIADEKYHAEKLKERQMQKKKHPTGSPTSDSQLQHVSILKQLVAKSESIVVVNDIPSHGAHGYHHPSSDQDHPPEREPAEHEQDLLPDYVPSPHDSDETLASILDQMHPNVRTIITFLKRWFKERVRAVGCSVAGINAPVGCANYIGLNSYSVAMLVLMYIQAKGLWGGAGSGDVKSGNSSDLEAAVSAAALLQLLGGFFVYVVELFEQGGRWRTQMLVRRSGEKANHINEKPMPPYRFEFQDALAPMVFNGGLWISDPGRFVVSLRDGDLLEEVTTGADDRRTAVDAHATTQHEEGDSSPPLALGRVSFLSSLKSPSGGGVDPSIAYIPYERLHEVREIRARFPDGEEKSILPDQIDIVPVYEVVGAVREVVGQELRCATRPSPLDDHHEDFDPFSSLCAPELRGPELHDHSVTLEVHVENVVGGYSDQMMHQQKQMVQPFSLPKGATVASVGPETTDGKRLVRVLAVPPAALPQPQIASGGLKLNHGLTNITQGLNVHAEAFVPGTNASAWTFGAEGGASAWDAAGGGCQPPGSWPGAAGADFPPYEHESYPPQQTQAWAGHCGFPAPSFGGAGNSCSPFGENFGDRSSLRIPQALPGFVGYLPAAVLRRLTTTDRVTRLAAQESAGSPRRSFFKIRPERNVVPKNFGFPAFRQIYLHALHTLGSVLEVFVRSRRGSVSLEAKKLSTEREQHDAQPQDEFLKKIVTALDLGSQQQRMLLGRGGVGFDVAEMLEVPVGGLHLSDRGEEELRDRGEAEDEALNIRALFLPPLDPLRAKEVMGVLP